MLDCITQFITWENVLFLQKELHFDDELVLQQIKYTGILQMVNIQKSGYSATYTFKVGNYLRMMCVFLYIDPITMCVYDNFLR